MVVKMQFLKAHSRKSPQVDFKPGDICTNLPINEIEQLMAAGIARPISHLEEWEQRNERKRARAEQLMNAAKFVD